MFFAALLLYVFVEQGAYYSATSREMFMIGTHRLPISALAGVFSSISNIIFICLVVFYHKVGFYTSLVIIIARIIRLTIGLLKFHGTSLPAIFISLVALISVLIIYRRNEKIRRVQETHQNYLEEFNKSIIGAFANCIDGKDTYTNGHSFRVAVYTRLLAQKLGENIETVEKYYDIALLHDIGKIGIPDAILNKPGKLTDEEFALMKSHAQRGYEILKDVKMQEDIAAGAHYHHERFDGKGYPAGLAGHNIPWVARIIAVADTFDAMSSTRSYRKKLPLSYIADEIKRCSGTQFDPVVAKAWYELYTEGAFNNLQTEETQ
ncbi:MAG: HD-GYP domain-containing protein [Treponema sp.]|nr:HD-GYP domain-containing protein [Treponema sp.]